MQFPKELQLMKPFLTIRFLWTGLNEVQFPKELQRGRRGIGGDPRRRASMKCSSRRNCNITRAISLNRGPGLNEVQFPKELQQVYPIYVKPDATASMKCSSRRNCNSPLSIARQQAHLRALRERSSRLLRLSPARLLLCSPHSRHSNVLLSRALPRVLRALERSRQAISGPSGVMVLVRPT